MGCRGRLPTGMNDSAARGPQSHGALIHVADKRTGICTITAAGPIFPAGSQPNLADMNEITDIVGLIVILGAILGFFGLRWRHGIRGAVPLRKM